MSSTIDRDTARSDFEEEVLAAYEMQGANFPKADIIKKYVALGFPQSTVYRWLDKLLRSGRPGQRMATAVRVASQERAAETPMVSESVAEEAAEYLPAPLKVEEIASAGGIYSVVRNLQECISIAHELIKHGRAEDGSLRNVKLVLAASEHLRRCSETAVALHQQVAQVSEVEAFHRTIMDELAAESPALAERVLRRLQSVNSAYSGTA